MVLQFLVYKTKKIQIQILIILRVTTMSKMTIPTISICFKKPSIRIYKDTLHLIGDPSHVLLFINPQKSSIIISPSDSTDSKALYVAKYLAKDKKSIELYSTFLIQELKKICDKFQNENSYRIYGEYILKEDIVKFNMSQSVEIKK